LPDNSLTHDPQENKMQKSKTLKGLLAVTAVAAMFSTVGVQAQTPASATQTSAAGQTKSSTSLSSGDEKALKDMAQADINEVAAAKIALSKAQSSEVKAYAQQMVDDHGGALTKVQTVAQQKGVTLPTEPDAKHKTMAAKLEKQSGAAFDKMYMKNAGTMDHKMVLSKLQSDAKKIKDPDVKAVADAHMPVVEQHLKSAQQMPMAAGK
jgi:putative membrane protein